MVSIGGGDVSGGDGLTCRGGRPLKNSWRGVGGEGAPPPPKMHPQNMLRDSPSVSSKILGALWSQFFLGSQKNILCP